MDGETKSRSLMGCAGLYGGGLLGAEDSERGVEDGAAFEGSDEGAIPIAGTATSG